jgi:guanosine-3',5'-bis(diphosphate) 3'-pyrophosphohydrolase
MTTPRDELLDQQFSDLTDYLKEHKKDFNLKRIQDAFEFARTAHEGQYRMSGEPYVGHPLEVARQLARFPVDEDTLIAGLLHDVPEDTKYSVEDVKERFGQSVGQIVFALTKLSKVYYKHSMDERQVQSLRRMFMEIAKDPRVVIVKLADRLHNMRTLRYLRPDKQQRIARESLEIYAPLAHLFGIFQIRRELEDLCFMILQPEEYQRIQNYLHDQETQRNTFIDDTIKILKKHFVKAKVSAEFSGRPKHFYSIYKKLIRGDKTLQEIYDYFAIRIIVEKEADCYLSLGVIHSLFKPKIGRLKDYISLPKINGYQSLHTTVVGLQGQLTEIQIRTSEMHYEASYGTAAHNLYKSDRLDLAKHILSLDTPGNSRHFIENLQEDLLQKKIFVFSPDGEVVNLPEGSTAIDYIYAINLPVNETVFRVIANGRVHSLTGQLQSGDHLEIVYGKKKQEGPERWWLDHVKTTRAKKAIRKYFRHKSFADRLELGAQLLQQELDHESKGLVHHLSESQIQQSVEALRSEDFPEVLSKIGDGTFAANHVYQLLYPELDTFGFDKLWHWIHSLKGRLNTNVEARQKYRIRVNIIAYDRPGLFREILRPFYQLKLPILKLKGRGYDVKDTSAMKTRYGNIQVNTKYLSSNSMEILVTDHEQLIQLFDRVEKIPGVIRVHRVFRRKQISFLILSSVILTYVVAHPWILIWIRDNMTNSENVRNISIYSVFGVVLLLLLWLRGMGNKTFPHFEETKWFWPITFGLCVLTFLTLLIDDRIFDLDMHAALMFGIFLFTLGLFGLSYRNHQKRRQRHLNHLKERRVGPDLQKQS